MLPRSFYLPPRVLSRRYFGCKYQSDGPKFPKSEVVVYPVRCSSEDCSEECSGDRSEGRSKYSSGQDLRTVLARGPISQLQ